MDRTDAAVVNWGRQTCRRLEIAGEREWLCTNGIGGFASGTVAGLLTRRYHGLLVAALNLPLGRALLAAKLDETVEHGGVRRALAANRWADGTIAPRGCPAQARSAAETLRAWHALVSGRP